MDTAFRVLTPPAIRDTPRAEVSADAASVGGRKVNRATRDIEAEAVAISRHVEVTGIVRVAATATADVGADDAGFGNFRDIERAIGRTWSARRTPDTGIATGHKFRASGAD